MDIIDSHICCLTVVFVEEPKSTEVGMRDPELGAPSSWVWKHISEADIAKEIRTPLPSLRVKVNLSS